MRKIFLKTVLIAAVITVMLSVSAMATNIGAGTVNATALNLREEANKEAKVITMAPRGSGFILKEAVGDEWWKVWYKGNDGYMATEFINLFLSGLDGNFGVGTVQGTTVRIRTEPALESEIKTYLDTGDVFSIVGVYGEWYKADLNGEIGYVHSDFVKISPPGVSSEVPSPDGISYAPEETLDLGVAQQLIEKAKEFLDVPYVWAGTTPSGFDCSGFVYYVFKQLGYNVNRTAASLYQNGYAVDRSELMPGDIICFTGSSRSYIGHVGIYVGDNKFIHASSGRGKVIITDLSENYYDARYYGARRVL